jgi:hypothetical protein
MGVRHIVADEVEGMRPARGLTTIHEPPKVLGGIVVTGLAPVMLACPSHIFQNIVRTSFLYSLDIQTFSIL